MTSGTALSHGAAKVSPLHRATEALCKLGAWPKEAWQLWWEPRPSAPTRYLPPRVTLPSGTLSTRESSQLTPPGPAWVCTTECQRRLILTKRVAYTATATTRGPGESTA